MVSVTSSFVTINSNKSCFWISNGQVNNKGEIGLTVTKVVFEFIIKIPPPGARRGLTVTKVVFEF